MTGLLGIITLFTFMFPFETIIIQRNVGISNDSGDDKNVIQQLGSHLFVFLFSKNIFNLGISFRLL